MREPPANLSNPRLLACLGADYQLPLTNVTFLPLGHDSEAWVYRASTADGSSYFVKVRLTIANMAGLLVPHHLAGAGVANVVAPLPTAAGALWTTVESYAVIAYPFVSSATAMDRGMTDGQWIAYGSTLRQVHDTAIDASLEAVIRRESYQPPGAELVRMLDQHIGDRHFDAPDQHAVAVFWQNRRSTILPLLERAETLGAALASARLPSVLCHADIHTNNVLVDGGGRIWFVDWDETTLAPRERDLMFVITGIRRDFVSARQEELFFRGYGAMAVDRRALAYYRYAWAVADIAAYGQQVFFRPDLGPHSRAEAADRFVSLFDRRSIVHIALDSEPVA